MFILLQFVGVSNCASVQPYIATERTVVYRERFAGMYSLWAYSFAQVQYILQQMFMLSVIISNFIGINMQMLFHMLQVMVEIPYVLLQAFLFLIITYPTINFYWSAYKVFWYFYTAFCTLLFYTYFGMMLVSLTPTYLLASVLSSFWYTMFNLFSGFLLPGPVSQLYLYLPFDIHFYSV